MFYPIVVVIEESEAGAAYFAEWLADELAARYGDDAFGLTLYGGGESVPAVSIFNDDEETETVSAVDQPTLFDGGPVEDPMDFEVRT